LTRLLHHSGKAAVSTGHIQRAELEFLARSQSAQATLAENYVGLPY
jgi:p-hydroxybenzoate 3-monooxygenase